MSNIDINNSCTDQYRYSRGFDSCLFLHGEPLRLTLLICTAAIFVLLILLFLMLIAEKKLLPNLIKQKHETIHSFLSQSGFLQNHDVQELMKSHSHSSKESQQSFSTAESHKRSEQTI